MENIIAVCPWAILAGGRSPTPGMAGPVESSRVDSSRDVQILAATLESTAMQHRTCEMSIRVGEISLAPVA